VRAPLPHLLPGYISHSAPFWSQLGDTSSCWSCSCNIRPSERLLSRGPSCLLLAFVIRRAGWADGMKKRWPKQQWSHSSREGSWRSQGRHDWEQRRQRSRGMEEVDRSWERAGSGGWRKIICYEGPETKNWGPISGRVPGSCHEFKSPRHPRLKNCNICHCRSWQSHTWSCPALSHQQGLSAAASHCWWKPRITIAAKGQSHWCSKLKAMSPQPPECLKMSSF
jgi:hypothetical protein